MATIALQPVAGANAGKPPLAGRGSLAGGPALLLVEPGGPDYAPSGMPDLSQCQAGWGRDGTPGQWTHAGPVALANALWWLDSRGEGADAPGPPTVSDRFSLVSAYPRFGPIHDDHAPENVAPLVIDLASRSNTEGIRRRNGVRGTRWEDLVNGASEYVASRGLADEYRIVARRGWDGQRAADEVGGGAAVVLLIGLWELQAVGPRRVGGHYATLAGVGDDGIVALADPLTDRPEHGRAMPPDRALHSCRENPDAHNDAAVVSYDTYVAAPAPVAGVELAEIQGYFAPGFEHEVAAFAGQNPAGFLDNAAAEWQRGPAFAAIEAMLVIGPKFAPTASPTPTATNTPEPTETSTPSPEPTGSTAPTEAPPVNTIPPTADSSPPPQAGWRLYLPLTSR